MGSRRVGVLHLDQPIPPALRQHRCLQVDAIDPEAVKLFERLELSRDPFDDVGKLRGLFVAVSNREDIDLA